MLLLICDFKKDKTWFISKDNCTLSVKAVKGSFFKKKNEEQ